MQIKYSDTEINQTHRLYNLINVYAVMAAIQSGNCGSPHDLSYFDIKYILYIYPLPKLKRPWQLEPDTQLALLRISED